MVSFTGPEGRVEGGGRARSQSVQVSPDVGFGTSSAHPVSHPSPLPE